MKKWLAYTIYVLIILVAFLYLLFPSEEIKAYIIQQAGQISPETKVVIGNIMPSFPPGLQFVDLAISLRGQTIVDASEIKVTPRYLSLFSNNKTFRVNGSVYQGAIDGEASVSNASKHQYEANFAFDALQVNQIKALNYLTPHQLYGIAEGSIQYDSSNGLWGNGESEVVINDCRIELSPPIFGFKELALGRVNAVIELQNRQLTIKEFTVNGKQVAGEASGTIGLRQPLDRSTIQINGKIKPNPALIKELSRVVPAQLLARRNYADNGIPFQVSGTFERPNFSLK
jgi:type II secretion system protein N